MGFSSCKLCDGLCWELQRLWREGEVSQAVPALDVLAAVRAVSAAGCKVQLMLCKARSGLNPAASAPAWAQMASA